MTQSLLEHVDIVLHIAAREIRLVLTPFRFFSGKGKNMKSLLLVSALMLSTGVSMGWQQLEVDGFLLRWQTQAGEKLAVELTGPTTGWVAVGFDPSMMMLDANIIIGYVSGGETFIRDDWGWQTTSHRADTLLGGTHDVIIDGGQESEGSTQIRFTIPLDSGDPYDKPLVPGNTYPILMARGPDGADDFTTYHAFYTVAEIEILAYQSFPTATWGRVKTGLE
jgi:hypothetical protein